jgi:hypothetical protein
MPPTPRPAPPPGLDAHDALRLRFWIGGQLRDEVWIDASDPRSGELAEFCATYHANQADMANAAGVPWLVEVYNPELPDEHAYVRFGTDTDGMVAPIPMNGTGG